MDFKIFETGFKEYLEAKGKIPKNGKSEERINIFAYADEFKDYLGKNFNSDNIQFQTKSVSDISKMDLNKKSKDKQVSEEELSAYENEVNLELQNNKIKLDMFETLFNQFLDNDEFKKAIDKDSSGKIDEKELENFANAIKNLDKDGKDISIDDLLVAAEKIKNGVFGVPDSEAKLTEKDKKSIQKDMKDKKVSSPSRLPSRSNVGGSQGGYNASGPIQAGRGTYNKNIPAKQPGNMNESELQAELTKANNDLSTKQSALSAILDGTDTKIKGLEDAVKSSYDAYHALLKEVDEDMAKQVDDLNTKINNKKKEISDKDKAISEKESSISSQENAYNNAKSTRENLESVLSDLQSQSTNTKNNDLSAKISEINSQISAAKAKETEAKEALEKSKQELETLKKEKQELETGDDGLNKLNEDMTKLQADIVAKHSEVKEAQDKWNKSKETLETEKASAKEKAQTDVTKAQEYVNKLETELTELKNNEVQAQYNNQYNDDVGSKIATQAQYVPGTVGRCLAGVADTLDAIYGAGAFPPIGSAYQAADYLAANDGIGAHFTEVQVSREELPNLPAGAVVVWDNNANGGGSNVSDAGRVHGHISIALGNGMESSDHIQEQIVNRDATFRVFYPKS